MKFLNWLIVPLLSFSVLYTACSVDDSNRSTDELFVSFISKNASGSGYSDKLFSYFEKADLQELREKSFFPERSLIVTVINLSDSFDVDTGKLYRLIDLLVDKGESIVDLDSSKCNFVDQLIMKGDVQLFRYLVDKGLRVPKEKNCTVDVLEKYRFRYGEDSYNVMLKELSRFI